METPTARSLKLLRSEGYLVDVVERRVGPVAKDLFGCIDILALHPDRGLLAVQTTSASNLASRRRKCLESEILTHWLNWGLRFELHGWSKPTATRRTWRVKREAL